MDRSRTRVELSARGKQFLRALNEKDVVSLILDENVVSTDAAHAKNNLKTLCPLALTTTIFYFIFVIVMVRGYDKRMMEKSCIITTASPMRFVSTRLVVLIVCKTKYKNSSVSDTCRMDAC